MQINGKPITFLDTPGHEAFTSMRARGAMVTDIAILVVAADDGIMPQTVEAINHAKAAGVPIIVAINKMDKPGANPEKIKQQLTEYSLVSEEWGGETIICPISAKQNQGIDKLLEMVALTAEMRELKANPKRSAQGTVIEARLDKGRGPVTTVLVQNGTLRQGDVIIAGKAVGRVRAMTDDKGEKLTEAGPSIPVEIIGMSEVPGAGDLFYSVADERMARELVTQRKSEEKAAASAPQHKVTLEDLFSQIQQGEVKELGIIVKADVQGTAEAVKASLEKLSNEEVRVRVIHSGVGAISESDIMLASTSNAIVVGFNIRPDKRCPGQRHARKRGCAAIPRDLRLHQRNRGCHEGDAYTQVQGSRPLGTPRCARFTRYPAWVRWPVVMLLDGKIVRASQVRVVRDGIVVFEGGLASLRRFKDDVKEVATGYECGIGIEKFNDVKEGDIIEAFAMEQIIVLTKSRNFGACACCRKTGNEGTMSGNRIARINEEIQRELVTLLRSVKDPRVHGMVSITAVDTTGDMRYAKVYISVLETEDAKEVLKGLRSAAGFLRRELSSALTLRYVPELIFEQDNSIRQGAIYF